MTGWRTGDLGPRRLVQALTDANKDEEVMVYELNEEVRVRAIAHKQIKKGDILYISRKPI